MVGVGLERSTPDSLAFFEHGVSSTKELVDCPLGAGDFGYLINVRVSGKAVNIMRTKMLIALPSVRQIGAFFVLKEIK